jgi:hypothetical protein
MSLDFIDKLIKATVILAALIFLGGVWFDPGWFLGLLIGALWGSANLYFIKKLIVSWLSPEQEKNWANNAYVTLIKFPLLYFLGYAILSSGRFTEVSLLAGFSLVPIVIVLNGTRLGKYLTGFACGRR